MRVFSTRASRALAVATSMLALAGPAHAAVGGDCTWREPGREPYTGSAARALMSFEHIAGHRRLALLGQIALGRPDDVVRIKRGSITGSPLLAYDPGIYDMHFGAGRRCGNVSREGWADDQTEIADVYRSGRWCVIRPRVCGNWAWTICDQVPAAGMRGASVHQVPEPGSLWLVLAGLGAAALITSRARASRGDDDAR